MSSKLIRDPLYGLIGLDEHEVALINTPFFQRLRHIKQLGNADFVYPSAVHSRFEHSIGAMHVAGEIAKQLDLSEAEIETARACLLLHDLGHGPFSHAFEDLLKVFNTQKVTHEDVGAAAFAHSPEIKKALGARYGRVRDAFKGKGKSIIYEIISGSIDADKMDYLRRDSYHAGVEYGNYDFHRIMKSLCRHEGYLALTYKGIDAHESFRVARLAIHTQIVGHHVNQIANEMLSRAVMLATEQGTLKKSIFRFDPERPERFLERYLNGGPFSSDHGFVRYVRDHSTGKARKMIDDYSARRLYKRALQHPVQQLETQIKGDIIRGTFDRSKMEKALAAKAGIGAHEVFVVHHKVDQKQYVFGGGAGDSTLLVRNAHGYIRPFNEYQVLQAPSDTIHELIVFGPDAKRQRLKKATQEYLSAAPTTTAAVAAM